MTSDSSESRIPGVEYGVCPPRNLNEVCSEPVLDDMHTHRLEVLYPDLFARLQRLTAYRGRDSRVRQPGVCSVGNADD